MSFETGKYTPEDAYRDHIRQTSGQEPTKPFEDLSDMAIQMYETEAAIVNEQNGGEE